jgi:hypothetical protein
MDIDPDSDVMVASVEKVRESQANQEEEIQTDEAELDENSPEE